MMKRILFILAFLCVLDFAAMAQGAPPLRIREADGSPSKIGISTIVVTNGTLTISGTTATIVTGGGGGGGLTVGTTTIASGTAGRLLYEAAGNVLGEISGVTSNGSSLTALPVAGVITQTSTSATAFESGPNGSTNPVFRLVNSTASAATGLSITGNAAGSGVTLTALSSGSNENIIINSKGNTSLISLVNGSTTALNVSTGGNIGVLIRNVGFYGWASGSINSSSITADAALGRAATAVVQVNNGGAGAGTFSSVALTPSQITADQNNYAPGVGWFQRWSSDASRNVTGLAAGVDGQVAEIWNVGANNIVFVNESASSTAANRFTTSTGADLTLSAAKCAQARYDSTSARWRVSLCN